MADVVNRNRRVAEAAENAETSSEGESSQSPVGAAIGTAGTALEVYGKVMGFTGSLAEDMAIPVFQALSFMSGIASLPASAQMDPVMGVDVHMVIIPPAPAVPLPHPYIAMMMDPMDWLSIAAMSVAAMAAPEPTGDSVADAAANLAFSVGMMALGMAGLGATIKIGGIPRSVAGTKNKSVPHFPLGTGFTTPPPILRDAGHAQFGSLFLNADGNPFTGMMHLNNDCWDVGSPQLDRGGSHPDPTHLFMPTGFVMSIPSQVIVNPVPTPINPTAKLTSLLNAGFAKLLHGILDKLPFLGRLGNMLSKVVCHVTGHPVDVVSGTLFTDEEDFSLPGVIPFSFERTWYSDSVYKGPLGHGWYHNYDMGFLIDKQNKGVFRMNDGRPAVFDLPAPGKSSFNRTEKLFLHCHAEEKYYYISNREGLIYRFTEKKWSNRFNKDEEHLLQSISNTNGYAIRFEYNRNGVVSGITDSAGRILTTTQDTEDRITQIIAPHPSEYGQTLVIAQYDYDDEGNMVCHTDALQQKMQYEYNDHLLVKETWRNGMQWYFVFDGKTTGARCIHTWGDSNIYNHKLTYYEGQTIVENSLGHVTTYNHKHGLLYSKIDANGAEWKYRYNRFNDLEWETDPLGNQQSYTHDEWGNLATATDAGGGATHTEYYNMQFPLLPTEATDAAGGKWKWEYDERGNLEVRINPLGAKTKYEYEDGLLVKITNDADAVTKLKYDKNQNLTLIETDDGATTEYNYDLAGNCISIINPNGVKQKRFFDLKARIEKVHDFDGNVIYLEYDGIDNVIRYRDKQKEVEYTYHGLWKLTSRREAGVGIIFKYDTEEQLVKIINEQGLPYRFLLDPAGNVIEEIGFDDITRKYERNPASWVTKVDRPGGKFTQYDHDGCGRVTNVLYSDDKKEIYTYRPDGELMQAINESAVVQFERNVMGDIVKETVNDEWIQSEYDVFSNRTKITSSLGANINQSYNKMGDVLQMEANGWFAKFEHDKLGLETNRLLPGAVGSNWQRDGIGRPVAQTVGHTANNIFNTRKRRQYTWDVNDRLKQIKDEKGITKFEHDAWSNLAKTIFPSGEEQLRNPDAVGNLFKTIDRKDRVYAKGGQLKKANGWNYEYDAEGNLIEKKHVSGDVWKFEWNDAGMLIKVIRPDKTEVKFTYDALGRRLSKQYKNTVTKFVWDGNVPLHEWKEHAVTGQKLGDINIDKKGNFISDSSNAPLGDGGITTWLFDTDSFAPACKIKGDKQYSIVSDHLGTPSQMYKEDGSLFWECELDSYGKLRMEKGDQGSCPFRYQGQYEDAETGLFYNRFRYYFVEEGIYLSQDPKKLKGGLSLYSYVNNTTIWIDPFGLESYAAKKKKLQEGGNGTVVKVKSRQEADKLLHGAFPGAQKVRGIGSQDAGGERRGRKIEAFKKDDGKVKYHKDYGIDPKTNRVYGHDDPKGTGHGEHEHVNIRREDGTTARIDIVKDS